MCKWQSAAAGIRHIPCLALRPAWDTSSMGHERLSTVKSVRRAQREAPTLQLDCFPPPTAPGRASQAAPPATAATARTKSCQSKWLKSLRCLHFTFRSSGSAGVAAGPRPRQQRLVEPRGRRPWQKSTSRRTLQRKVDQHCSETPRATCCRGQQEAQVPRWGAVDCVSFCS